jgi:hypothetical protein
MNWSAPLILESWRVMMPAGLSTILKRELPGYLEYFRRVRYRVVHFIF